MCVRVCATHMFALALVLALTLVVASDAYEVQTGTADKDKLYDFLRQKGMLSSEACATCATHHPTPSPTFATPAPTFASFCRVVFYEHVIPQQDSDSRGAVLDDYIINYGGSNGESSCKDRGGSHVMNDMASSWTLSGPGYANSCCVKMWDDDNCKADDLHDGYHCLGLSNVWDHPPFSGAVAVRDGNVASGINDKISSYKLKWEIPV